MNINKNRHRDIIAQAQSGTGKTATYSIGILQNIDHTIPNTQASSQGAGHSLPVNSGKLLVLCKMVSARSHSFLYTASLKSGMRLPTGQPL